MGRETLLSTCDVAKLAGVTPEAVRQWARAGRLPVAVQSESGMRMYRRADAERLIRARRKRANGA
jgi:DNA-binding transcriptional MerR regulator